MTTFMIEVNMDVYLRNEVVKARLEHAREHPWYRDQCEECDIARQHTDEELVENYKAAKARLGEALPEAFLPRVP